MKELPADIIGFEPCWELSHVDPRMVVEYHDGITLHYPFGTSVFPAALAHEPDWEWTAEQTHLYCAGGCGVVVKPVYAPPPLTCPHCGGEVPRG